MVSPVQHCRYAAEIATYSGSIFRLAAETYTGEGASLSSRFLCRHEGECLGLSRAETTVDDARPYERRRRANKVVLRHRTDANRLGQILEVSRIKIGAHSVCETRRLIEPILAGMRASGFL